MTSAGRATRTSSVYDYSASQSIGGSVVVVVRRRPAAAAAGPAASRAAAAAAASRKAPPTTLAPEVLLCEPYGPEVDWWALGVVVFELLVGVPPFHAATPVKIFEKHPHRDDRVAADETESESEPETETETESERCRRRRRRREQDGHDVGRRRRRPTTTTTRGYPRRREISSPGCSPPRSPRG